MIDLMKAYDNHTWKLEVTRPITNYTELLQGGNKYKAESRLNEGF